jgi:uncharacterized membrane protein YozB (DUF420 family)
VKFVLTGPLVILILKVAVAAVSVLLLASVVALAAGRVRLHGRINLAFFLLTYTTVLGFEGLIRFGPRDLFAYITENPEMQAALNVHLCFAIPSALLMPVLLFTGLRRYRRVHLMLAVVFAVLWIGTFITGIFYLPHTQS